MATREKIPPRRAHKESHGGGRGARRTRLTELQKVLLVNGGVGHFLRAGKQRQPADVGKFIAQQARAAEDKYKGKSKKKLGGSKKTPRMRKDG